MDHYCISPFPDGREKIQSRHCGKRNPKLPLISLWNLLVSSLPSKRNDTFLPFIRKGKKISLYPWPRPDFDYLRAVELVLGGIT
jgi:hypothetical protein